MAHQSKRDWDSPDFTIRLDFDKSGKIGAYAEPKSAKMDLMKDVERRYREADKANKKAAAARAKQAAKRSHKRIDYIEQDVSGSECFSSLEWDDGIANAIFRRDGYELAMPMTLKEFRDWQKNVDDDGDGAGTFFNNEL